jgi:tetratricopeptide (TPR) repeat protein
MLIPMTLALSRWQTPSGKKRVGVPALLVAVAGASLCVVAIRQTQVPILLNEASADYARSLDSLRLSAGAAELYRRASDHAPRDLNARIQGTKALMTVAETSSDTDQYLRTVRKAEAYLEAGLKLGDRNVLNYYHGNVLMRQAVEMPAGAEREATARRAHAAYEAALIYAPNTEVAWFERSLVERILLGDKAAADASLARADEIAATVDAVVFGEQYSYQMQTTVNPVLNPAYGKRGVDYFTRALVGAASLPAEKRADLLVTKGTLLVNLRQPGEARACLLEATKLGETTDRWRAHAMLAELFLKAGDRASAAPHLDEAIGRAPDAPRRNLQELKARVFR